MKVHPPKSLLPNVVSEPPLDRLRRQRRRSEQALLDAIEEEPHRDSLISVTDVEELTGNVARQAAAGVAEALKTKRPELNVSGRWRAVSFGARGSTLGVLLALLLVLVIGLVWLRVTGQLR